MAGTREHLVTELTRSRARSYARIAETTARMVELNFRDLRRVKASDLLGLVVKPGGTFPDSGYYQIIIGGNLEVTKEIALALAKAIWPNLGPIMAPPYTLKLRINKSVLEGEVIYALLMASLTNGRSKTLVVNAKSIENLLEFMVSTPSVGPAEQDKIEKALEIVETEIDDSVGSVSVRTLKATTATLGKSTLMAIVHAITRLGGLVGSQSLSILSCSRKYRVSIPSAQTSSTVRPDELHRIDGAKLSKIIELSRRFLTSKEIADTFVIPKIEEAISFKEKYRGKGRTRATMTLTGSSIPETEDEYMRAVPRFILSIFMTLGNLEFSGKEDSAVSEEELKANVDQALTTLGVIERLKDYIGNMNRTSLTRQCQVVLETSMNLRRFEVPLDDAQVQRLIELTGNNLTIDNGEIPLDDIDDLHTHKATTSLNGIVNAVNLEDYACSSSLPVLSLAGVTLKGVKDNSENVKKYITLALAGPKEVKSDSGETLAGLFKDATSPDKLSLDIVLTRFRKRYRNSNIYFFNSTPEDDVSYDAECTGQRGVAIEVARPSIRFLNKNSFMYLGLAANSQITYGDFSPILEAIESIEAIRLEMLKLNSTPTYIGPGEKLMSYERWISPVLGNVFPKATVSKIAESMMAAESTKDSLAAVLAYTISSRGLCVLIPNSSLINVKLGRVIKGLVADTIGRSSGMLPAASLYYTATCSSTGDSEYPEVEAKNAGKMKDLVDSPTVGYTPNLMPVVDLEGYQEACAYSSHIRIDILPRSFGEVFRLLMGT